MRRKFTVAQVRAKRIPTMLKVMIVSTKVKPAVFVGVFRIL